MISRQIEGGGSHGRRSRLDLFPEVLAGVDVKFPRSRKGNENVLLESKVFIPLD